MASWADREKLLAFAAVSESAIKAFVVPLATQNVAIKSNRKLKRKVGVIMKYCNEYVEQLEKVAEQMMVAIEEGLSIIDDSRMALVNPKVAEQSLTDSLDKYHQLDRDWSDD